MVFVLLKTFYALIKLLLMSFLFFFFLMIRPPPRSTLFPSRRSSDLIGVDLRVSPTSTYEAPCAPKARSASYVLVGRSEEHTSELQSRFDLVCRLLLEKKKNLLISVRPRYPNILQSLLTEVSLISQRV